MPPSTQHQDDAMLTSYFYPGQDSLHMFDIATGQTIVDITDLETAVIADSLAVCNFTSQRQLDVDVPAAELMDGSGSGRLQYADTLSADDCERLLVFEYGSYVVLIQGYLSPLVVLLTLINNTMICIVLLQRNMRTPTNVCLVALAVSDALTGLVPAPVFIHFYAYSNFRTWMVPTAWCHLYPALTLHLPTIWHTTSIWLTVALAVQRYIYVKHPATAKRLCTVPNTVRVVVGIYLTAFVSQLTCFFQYQYTNVQVHMPWQTSVFEGCYVRYAPFLASNNDLYFSIYWFLRVIFINLIPCVLLVVLNIHLYVAMRHAQMRRRQLFHNSHDHHVQQQQQQQQHMSVRQRISESRRLAENNAATLMLLTVVGVFLLVEFPLAVMLMTMIAENQFEPLQLMDPSRRRTATLFINFFILLSYPVNFFIYCGMSHQFRKTFRRLMLIKCRTSLGGGSTSSGTPAAAAAPGNPERATVNGRPAAEVVRGSSVEAAGSDLDEVGQACCPCDRRSSSLRRRCRQPHSMMLSMVTDNPGLDLEVENAVSDVSLQTRPDIVNDVDCGGECFQMTMLGVSTETAEQTKKFAAESELVILPQIDSDT